jgi:hypothetical protein
MTFGVFLRAIEAHRHDDHAFAVLATDHRGQFIQAEAQGREQVIPIE